MDKTKSKLAAFFGDDEEEQPFPQKFLDDAKLSQYASGKVRKSRREKEQEAAEAKRKEEEASAAQAYAEFLETFEGKESSRKSGSAFVRADTKTAYVPAGGSSQQQQSSTGGFFKRSPSPTVSAPKPKGKRAMDSFLEEIKRDQAEREAKYAGRAGGRSVTALAAYEGQSGSKDRGDPLTSNIFVANLPPHVTEQSLGLFFAKVGPVGSVKIMWPRGDASSGPGADMTSTRKAKSAGLSGFVSYMKRRDAEEALREFDGFDWGGSILRFQIVIEAEAGVAAVHRIDGVLPPLVDIDDQEVVHGTGHHVEGDLIVVPEVALAVHSGKAVAAEVKGHGSKYEQMLKEREKSNPKYKFMLERTHRRHAFYRGLLESETFNEPEFDDDGYNSVYSTDSGEESERERTRKNVLGKLARKRFEAMLRAMSGKCGEVARCMVFCLEHAEAAHEVADIIVSSLLVDSTPVPRKVARLYLICDILHNSAAPVPSAWRFRQEFQSRLGIVFDHLANIYHSFPGRITADLFKKQITTVVDIWEDWIVFPPDFTAELRERLEGHVTTTAEGTGKVAPSDTGPATTRGLPSKFKAAGFQPATDPVTESKPASEAPSDGEPMDVSDGESSKNDLDGEPVKEDLDGEPMEDVDGEPLEDDIDGEPVVDDLDGEPAAEDLDGDPIDDDLDGKPVAEDLDGEPLEY
ncbi:SR140 protein [Coprinopsis cinerea okayama7|uniref:SR140 protein n=1 Tax=Coprinopsis cinerea (strain Okayama-7 / 130 / ATCC MYA-4618 / FGSC 9003) TaxID=240176 RepID=A8N661_COPC7|nr:SR140 protein [Coprinopsis cinerea okayama7\|eukprot:XP_001830340.2 SR140 protein [Coprinopsis cinerea okayama7\